VSEAVYLHLEKLLPIDNKTARRGHSRLAPPFSKIRRRVAHSADRRASRHSRGTRNARTNVTSDQAAPTTPAHTTTTNSASLFMGFPREHVHHVRINGGRERVCAP
jgi:hypothetical protein